MRISLNNIKLSCLLVPLILFSCNNEGIMPDKEETDKGASSSSLVFYLDAGTGFATRAIANGVEDREDYVDPKNTHVLFFSEGGYFLFDASASELEVEDEVKIEGEENRTYVKVEVQLGNIKDENNNPVGKTIHENLSKNKFKVAVLANWPETPDWKYATNSKLNNSIDQTAYKTLNDLHFLKDAYDTGYVQDFVNNNGMPEYSDWDNKRTGYKSTEKLIPMFGVQEFDPLGVWINGESIELTPNPNSSGNNGSTSGGASTIADVNEITVKEGDPISLIRSVAKVEVYFYTNPVSVQMMNMNSKAYCEPVDVNTSTSESWVKDHYNDNCEWFNIQKYGLWEGNYAAWMKGLYNSWFDSNNVSSTWNTTTYGKYPRIFHPHVESLIDCKFNYAGSQNGLDKWVIYVPEQCIATPESITDGNNPKVPYIEYKYPNETGYHRIYFTNYTDNEDKYTGPVNEAVKTIGGTLEEHENYLKSMDNLKKHWPIMRNHVYRFTVKKQDVKEVDLILNVRINPWEYDPQDDWEEVW